jgi:hypothetical protein
MNYDVMILGHVGGEPLKVVYTVRAHGSAAARAFGRGTARKEHPGLIIIRDSVEAV